MAFYPTEKKGWRLARHHVQFPEDLGLPDFPGTSGDAEQGAEALCEDRWSPGLASPVRKMCGSCRQHTHLVDP